MIRVVLTDEKNIVDELIVADEEIITIMGRALERGLIFWCCKIKEPIFPSVKSGLE